MSPPAILLIRSDGMSRSAAYPSAIIGKDRKRSEPKRSQRFGAVGEASTHPA